MVFAASTALFAQLLLTTQNTTTGTTRERRRTECNTQDAIRTDRQKSYASTQIYSPAFSIFAWQYHFVLCFHLCFSTTSWCTNQQKDYRSFKSNAFCCLAQMRHSSGAALRIFTWEILFEKLSKNFPLSSFKIKLHYSPSCRYKNVCCRRAEGKVLIRRRL